MKHLSSGKAEKRRWNTDQLSCQTNWDAHGSVLSWILQSKCKLCVITYYPGSEQAFCKPELMADRFLNTKWVVVPAEIQTQHRKNDVQFISIPKGNKTIFPESQASRKSMDFEIFSEAEADILHWKRYSSYTAFLIVNRATKNISWNSSGLQSKSQNVEEMP